MTQRDLSLRLGELGRPMLPTAIAKIEKGQRRVDVDDLVAIAVALNVAPSRLLLPDLTEDEPIPLTPEYSVAAWEAWDWARGGGPLSPVIGQDPSDEAWSDWNSQWPPALIARDQHPIATAVRGLVGRVSRLLRTQSDQARKLNVTGARRAIEGISLELDELEEGEVDRRREREES